MEFIAILPNGEEIQVKSYLEEDTQSTEYGDAFLHDFGNLKEQVEKALSLGARITEHRIKL